MSEIEWYLDELFDQLAGTGAAGRRALMEAEYHLRATAADAMARGLPEDQAGHEAVSRFGPPALVARTLRSAGRLNRAVSTGWLLAGLAGCGLGVAYLVAVWWHTWQTPNCTFALSYGCYTTGMLVLVALRSTVMLEAGGADTYTSQAIPGSEPRPLLVHLPGIVIARGSHTGLRGA